MQISWRGGGSGGGAAPPPQAAHQILIKQVLAAKMRLRSADTFNRLIALLLAWLVPVLLLCCGSWRLRLWLLSLLLVLVAVVVDPNSNWSTPPYKSLSRRSEPELELEPVHPPRVDNCVVDPNSNSNSNRSTPPGSIIVCRSELELELEPVHPPRLDNCVSIRTRTRTGPPPPPRLDNCVSIRTRTRTRTGPPPPRLDNCVSIRTRSRTRTRTDWSTPLSLDPRNLAHRTRT